MSQTEQETMLLETTDRQSSGDSAKLVPVAESIRYRKRAQAAEKEAEELAKKLADVNSDKNKLAERLNSIELEQALTQKLAAAGTIDLETAVLIAKARMKNQPQADPEDVVKQLKEQKRHLFKDNEAMVTTRKTSGPRYQLTNNHSTMEKAAKRAAMTGNRIDLQEYLKLRRNFV